MLFRSDPAEIELPCAGIIEFADAEDKNRFIVDTSSLKTQELFKKHSRQIMAERKGIFNSAGIDFVEVNSGESYIKALIKFFRMREQRAR